ncbi:T9SS type A sorting domain-containing protein [Hymenobacter sp. J193]|uniref:T9SS type A sorting domain-containing protein n=1 Tax=Hymenobacter sp. J193 TaxID=2898429 RepID=UPI002150C3AE|nr:T9SS type A sorting domain-containing protein [Hymenobacter sp. J193]MCR5887203.1 T9SS type A sorting domain-containing protein [Hymenobacter sp. J193]
MRLPLLFVAAGLSIQSVVAQSAHHAAPHFPKAQLGTKALREQLRELPRTTVPVLPTTKRSTAKRQPQAPVVPYQGHAYNWEEGEDGAAGKWVDAAHVQYTYNANAQVTQEVYTDSITHENLSQTLNTYNAQGVQTESIQQDWDGKAWENYERTATTFDAQQMATEEVTQEWSGTAWETYEGSKYENTYNAAKQLTSRVTKEYDVEEGAFINALRETYVLGTDGKPTQITFEEWADGAWEASYRHTDIVWHDYALGQARSYNFQELDEKDWVTTERYSATYTATGSVATTEYLEGENWIAYMRDTETRDEYGNLAELKLEDWNGDSWEYFYGIKNASRYNAAGNLIQQATQLVYPFFGIEEYTPLQMYTFTDFKEVALSSKARELAGRTSLYPNPATDAATLELPALRQAGMVRVEILNGVGQVLRTVEVRTQPGVTRATLELSGLSAGVYLVRAHTPEGTVTKRLMHR